MSTSLYWRPTPKREDGEHFGYQLKFSIAEELFGHDGSLGSDWVSLNTSFIP